MHTVCLTFLVDLFSTGGHMMIMNGEEVRIWKGALVAFLEGLFEFRDRGKPG